MNRKTYIDELSKKLSKLPKEEREDAINYYNEYFDEAQLGEEDEVPDTMKTPAQAASDIIQDCAIKVTNQPPKTVKKGIDTVWIVLLAILAAPIALPIAAAILSVFVALGAVCFAFVVTILALDFSIFAVGIGCFIATIEAFTVSVPLGLLMIGIGLLMFGLGAFGFILVAYAAKGLCYLISKLFSLIFRKNKEA